MTAFRIIEVIVEALEMTAVNRREEEQLAIKEESIAWMKPLLVAGGAATGQAGRAELRRYLVPSVWHSKGPRAGFAEQCGDP